jgi:hypothetical protein
LSFQKSGADALASRALIFCSRPATSKIPPEGRELLFERLDLILYRYLFHESSDVFV